MSFAAEDAFNATSIRRADQDVDVPVGRSGTDSIDAHAEDPFRPTPLGASRGLEVAIVDRVPVP